MDQRFDKIENRLDDLGKRVDSLERRMIAIEDILTEHGKILRRHEQEPKSIKKTLIEIRESQREDGVKIINLEKRVTRLESKIPV